MRQEVRVLVEITLDIDTKIDKSEIKSHIDGMLLKEMNKEWEDIQIMTWETKSIKEESKIYKTEGPYHIDYKRQTKLEL